MDQTIDLTEHRYFRSQNDSNRLFEAINSSIGEFRAVNSSAELMMSDSAYDDLYGRDFIINHNKKLEIVSELALEVGNRCICPRCGRVSIKPSYTELCDTCNNDMDYDLYNPLHNKEIIRNSTYFNI